MGEDYTSATRGTLKLKGVPSGRVDKPKHKKKKKNRPKDVDDAAAADTKRDQTDVGAEPRDQSGKGREALDSALREEDEGMGANDGGEGRDEERPAGAAKTEAQIRHEAHRRKQLDERLKREGVKTHKERVEELNRYLSGLSEHHDMPRIGPG